MPIEQKNSLSTLATDPLRNFKFRVTFHDKKEIFSQKVEMGFVSVTGLNVTTDVIPYRQGGYNTTTQKMPGQSDFAPITLSKGLMLGDRGPIQWMQRLFSAIQGTGKGTGATNFRFTMDIAVIAHPVPIDRKAHVHARFRVYNAWPNAIAFSDLDAGANAIIVNQMTLAHEGWRMTLSDSFNKDAAKL